MRHRRARRLTLRSFDYQWRHLPFDRFLLSDETFRKSVADYLLDELRLSRDWFRNRLVVDAGCGIGRWTYGFTKLGADVVAFDASPPACYAARRLVRSRAVEVLRADAEHPPLKLHRFDLVFCWGVLHHLRNPTRAFRELGKLVRAGGFLHLYVYGRKGVRIRFWRAVLQFLPLRPRHLLLLLLTAIRAELPGLRPMLPMSPSIHANFDAFSPAINLEYVPAVVRKWFEQTGFTGVVEIRPEWFGIHTKSADIHMRGTRLLEP